jgi:beta-glucanase (GH16 family)
MEDLKQWHECQLEIGFGQVSFNYMHCICFMMFEFFFSAIWLMPEHSVYGEWPRSGEIDLVETRGNRNLMHHGTNIGVQQIGSTMHFGPYWNVNGWPTAHYTRNQQNGFHVGFHRYQLEWTPGILNL